MHLYVLYIYIHELSRFDGYQPEALEETSPVARSVTQVRNVAAIWLFSTPCLARSTGELPLQGTIRPCHSRDIGGTIRRAGRAHCYHIVANQPRNEFARFRRPHSSAGSAAAGIRASLAPDNGDKTPAVRLFANDDGSDGSNMPLPSMGPSHLATYPALSACVPHVGKVDT